MQAKQQEAEKAGNECPTCGQAVDREAMDLDRRIEMNSAEMVKSSDAVIMFWRDPEDGKMWHSCRIKDSIKSTLMGSFADNLASLVRDYAMAANDAEEEHQWLHRAQSIKQRTMTYNEWMKHGGTPIEDLPQEIRDRIAEAVMTEPYISEILEKWPGRPGAVMGPRP